MNAQTAKNLPTPAEAKAVVVREAGGGGMLLPQSLQDVMTFAKLMASADIAVPKHLRGNEGACLAVSMQAFRWEMDPFAVANKSYFVNDRIAYEAQLIAAVVQTRAPIIGFPIYSYSGEGPTRRCKVEVTMRDNTVQPYETPMFKDITVKNSPLWKSDLDQQLGYFAIRSWARRYSPEVILGVYTPDEVAVMKDVTPREGSGLAASLAAEGVGGFSVENINRAIDGEFEDVTDESEVEAGEVAAGSGDQAQPVASEDAAGPEVRPKEVAGDAEGSPDPLLILIDEATVDQIVAWVEALKATISKNGKTPQTAMAIWRRYYETQIKGLHKVAPQRYEALDAWMAEHMKRIRQNEGA